MAPKDIDAVTWGLYRNPEKTEAEKYADESEAIAHELLGMNAAKFTVNEIGWLIKFVTTWRSCTTAEQELEMLEAIRCLRQRINDHA